MIEQVDLLLIITTNWLTQCILSSSGCHLAKRYLRFSRFSRFLLTFCLGCTAGPNFGRQRVRCTLLFQKPLNFALLLERVFHHVARDKPFADKYLFYRMYIDDETLSKNNKTSGNK